MKIRITMDLDDEYVDPDHAKGITEEGYDRLSENLGELGSDINVERAS